MCLCQEIRGRSAALDLLFQKKLVAFVLVSKCGVRCIQDRFSGLTLAGHQWQQLNAIPI
jgi:hypothetical protein